MQEGLTLPKTTETTTETTTEPLTERAWCHSEIPQGENRIDVRVTLILDKLLYRRFMTLIQNDSLIFQQAVSDIIGSNLENWAGKYLSSGCPEVLLRYVEAALNKHLPLPESNDESGKEEA
jgi:hypothetical protein